MMMSTLRANQFRSTFNEKGFDKGIAKCGGNLTRKYIEIIAHKEGRTRGGLHR